MMSVKLKALPSKFKLFVCIKKDFIPISVYDRGHSQLASSCSPNACTDLKKKNIADNFPSKKKKKKRAILGILLA